MKKVNKAVEMANLTIESLKLAFQENPDCHGLMLAALAMVTQMREELAGSHTELTPCDPSEYCYPV
jgi:hypothetical protein